MTNERGPEYHESLRRFTDRVRLQGSGKVPFVPLSIHFFPATLAGVSFADVMKDHKLRFDCLANMTTKYDLMMAPPDGLRYGSHASNLLQETQWEKPGFELEDDRAFQFLEKENMLEEEYEHFLSDPSDFTVRVVWPRMAGALEPLGQLPPLHYYLNSPMFFSPFFARSDFVDMLETWKRLGDEWSRYNEAWTGYVQSMAAESRPLVYSGSGYPPFDLLSVYLRGLRGSMLDIRRVPEKLLAAVDMLADRQIGLLKLQAELSGCPRVVLYCYRGADVFMSDEQYRKFYWPSLRKVIVELVDAGITPIPYFEVDVTSRLPYFKDLPAGKVPIHYESVDRLKVRQTLGESNAFWGNIPASLVALGTPDEVKADVRELIDIFGDTNGLMIDTAHFPDVTKPENVEAIIEAIEQYS